MGHVRRLKKRTEKTIPTPSPVPSLTAASARQRSHFFPSSFSDMLSYSSGQASSVKATLHGAAFTCGQKWENGKLFGQSENLVVKDSGSVIHVAITIP